MPALGSVGQGARLSTSTDGGTINNLPRSYDVHALTARGVDALRSGITFCGGNLEGAVCDAAGIGSRVEPYRILSLHRSGSVAPQ